MVLDDLDAGLLVYIREHNIRTEMGILKLEATGLMLGTTGNCSHSEFSVAAAYCPLEN